MDLKITYLPAAIPKPIEFNIKARIEQLRSYLDQTNTQRDLRGQDENIKTVIKLYENGEIDGIREVCVMNGKVVTEEEADKGPSCSWRERIGYQLVSKCS